MAGTEQNYYLCDGIQLHVQRISIKFNGYDLFTRSATDVLR